MSGKRLRKILCKLGVLRDLSLALPTPLGTAKKIQISFGGTHPSLAFKREGISEGMRDIEQCKGMWFISAIQSK